MQQLLVNRDVAQFIHTGLLLLNQLPSEVKINSSFNFQGDFNARSEQTSQDNCEAAKTKMASPISIADCKLSSNKLLFYRMILTDKNTKSSLVST